MTADPAFVLLAALITSQCEPNRGAPRLSREPGFAQGMLVTLALAAAVCRARPAPGLVVALEIAGYALFFVVGYRAGRWLRGISRPRAVALAAACILVDAIAIAAFRPPTAAPPRFAEVATGLGSLAYVVIALGGLRRISRAGEAMFNSVEERVLATVVVHWYALDRASSMKTAQAVAAYLGAADLLTRMGLKLALWAFQWSPLFTVGRPSPYTSLRVEAQEAHLGRVERSGFIPLRFALLSLRLVSGMLHYESLGSVLSANPACPPPAGS